MTDFTEKFAAAGKSSIDVLFSLANTAFDSSERLVALNLNTSRSLLDEGVANAKALLAVKDVQELVKLQASFGQPLVNKAAGYARGAYEIVAQSQEEVSKVVEAQFAEFSKQFTAALESAAKSAPGGSSFAVDAVRSALAAANTAYENVSKAAKQAVELTQSNIEAATEAAEKAARPAKKVA